MATHRDYASLASSYDELRFSGGKGEFNSRADAAIIDELVALTGATTIHDVPVGTGRVAEYLRNRDVRIIGADLTSEMLAKAAARAARTKCAPLELMQCDASHLPFHSGSIDCLVSLRFFHLIAHDSRPLFASEFSRVLKPGGHLICSFTNGWYAGGLNWLGKLFGTNTLYFLRPGEVRQLFPGFRVRAVRGNFWPLQRLLPHIADGPANWSLRLNRCFPFNRLCWEVFYLLQKPGP